MTIHQSVDGRAHAGAMKGVDRSIDPEPEVLERARPPRQYSAKYKAEVLEEYERLDKAGKGALLRREALYYVADLGVAQAARSGSSGRAGQAVGPTPS